MASLGVKSFDATTVKPFSETSVIPKGVYRARIVTSREQEPKGGGEKMLVLTFEVIEGEQKGSRLDTFLLTQHADDKVRAIAHGKLSAICHATGRLKLTDSVQLHNLTCFIQVEVKPRNDDPSKFNNEISRYLSAKEMADAAAAAKGAPAAGPAPLGGTPAAAKPLQPKAQPKPAPTPEPDPEPSGGDDSDPFANET